MAPKDADRTFGSIVVDEEGSEISCCTQPCDKKATAVYDAHQVVSNEYVLNIAFLSFVGFLLVQAVFALIANSQAMLADSEAMSVDALTYLFNLMAERVKTRPYSAVELELSDLQRLHRRELERLYLEFVPPAMSVMTLIAVTIMTLKEAFSSLYGSADGDEEIVSLPIMISFSGANLILDIVNVTCFARAHSIYGLDILRPSRRHTTDVADGTAHESTDLLQSDKRIVLDDDHDVELVNLNMCSAWTHICADTLRSTAVLVAAILAMTLPNTIDGSVADSVAAIAVSLIIFGSILPLLRGLVMTAQQIRVLKGNQPPETIEV